MYAKQYHPYLLHQLKKFRIGYRELTSFPPLYHDIFILCVHGQARSLPFRSYDRS